jgi:hypothetical protein
MGIIENTGNGIERKQTRKIPTVPPIDREGGQEIAKFCFWGHSWTKWDQKFTQITSFHISTTQTRYCLRCNKMQKEYI